MEADLTQKQKHLVVSAVNLTEGGPLTVLQESLDAAAQFLPADWRITALVNCKDLITNPRIETLAFPHSKRSWFKRLWVEWMEFNRLSKALMPDLWLSLHDITPRVRARRQAVYCHNPSQFYKLRWRDALLDTRFALFNLLYGRLYGIFLSRNHTVVVQQAWLRQAFRRLNAHPNVVVSYPTQSDERPPVTPQIYDGGLFSEARPLVMLYPALPRVFKNMEVLCEAMKLLPQAVKGIVELRLTLSGTENPYARDLHKQFSKVCGVRFIGRQTKQQMAEAYRACDVVLFPSRLETWGLPITEAKTLNKPLLVVDLPYAYETVGNCSAVSFLPATDAQAWANVFEKVACGQHKFGSQTRTDPEAPFAANWEQLWRLLTHGL
jgi:glycosyltransferase involved in cell wall biosynthesis